MAFDILSDFNLTRGPNQTLSGVTPNNSQAVDMKGFEALTAYLETGVVTDAGTADGFTMKLQHSDTLVGTSFEDVPAALVKVGGSVTVTDDADDTIVSGGIAYFGGKRYVRAVFTGTTDTDAVVHVMWLRGRSSSISRPVPTVGATVATT
jgi:hypothetical protein